jgi:hypothetical protein
MFPVDAQSLIRSDEDFPLANKIIDLLLPYWVYVRSKNLSSATIRRKEGGIKSIAYTLFDICSVSESDPDEEIDSILDYYRCGEDFDLSYRQTLLSAKDTQDNFDNVCREMIRMVG